MKILLITKSTIIFLLLFFRISVFGQVLPINPDTKKIEYEKIFEIPNKNKLQLYTDIKTWINSNSLPILFEDSTQNIKIISEKQFRSKWIDKSLISTSVSKEYGILYKILFDIKDQKIRCRISEINFLEYKNASATGAYWGNGIVTSKIKEAEIIKTEAENYYPVDKNKGKYKDIYKFFFDNLNEDAIETIKSINIFITKENNDW